MMTNVLQRAATVASVCFNQWLAGTPYPTGSSVSYNGFNYNNSLLVLPSDGAPGSGSGNGKWNMQGACITAVTSNVPATTTTTTTTSTRTTSSTSIPTRASLNSQSVDWVAKGYVTSIKSQANYGACVVFTTIELMEAYYYGQTKNLTSFSEQQVFDCFPAFSSDFNGCGQHKVGSCGGTNPSYGFQTLNILRNLQTYDQNPWLGAQGGCIDNRDTGFDNCPLPNAPTGVCAAGGGWNFASVSYTGGTGETWMSFDVMSGPVGATINCACASWMHYHSGILTADACGKMSGVNHAVSVVGYNWNEGAPYWIVKNHWDTTWGMQGYAWVAAGYNAFNIASYSYLQIASVS
ncbi:hypothetical protein BC830DRAFT_1136940 [Chytriomyces sp. MP71]|nr:hypothetical protein BC830DRAFT_1136940 [Chytriomyces sp. MP71]